MKILVVSQYFYPENFRINDLVLELKKRGHEITVLTGKPNYPKGEYFPNYSFRGKEDEIWQGVPIYRVALRARKKGGLNLIRNYISFVWNGNKKIKQLISKQTFDVIYVFEVSPITVALPAIKAKKRLHIPLIMNVQDLWPENIIAITGIKNRFVIYLINRLVNYIYHYCDLLLVSSPAFIDKISSRLKGYTKIEYWPQYSLISQTEKISNIFDSNKFNITFTGNIGEAQGLDLVVEAVHYLKDSSVVFHLIGDGRAKEKLEEKVQQCGLEQHIQFHGFIEENKISQYLAASDAALLILKADPIFEMTIPAKLQTYLACGTPILGCVHGISKKIIEESQSGLLCYESSGKALADSAKQLSKSSSLQVFRNNALKYYEENFNKEVLINQLLNEMEELINEYI